jgi:hypothetical protein
MILWYVSEPPWQLYGEFRTKVQHTLRIVLPIHLARLRIAKSNHSGSIGNVSLEVYFGHCVLSDAQGRHYFL